MQIKNSVFLVTGGASGLGEATARELFVHPNTVRYRLKRVSEVIGWDATGPREALILQTALILGSIGTESVRRRPAALHRRVSA